MFTGTAERTEIPFGELGQYFRSLKKNQAIAHGITDHKKVEVVTADAFQGQPGTIARTKHFFRYSLGSGLGLFDHDPKPGHRALTPDEFINVVCEAWSGFKDLPTICTPSTSACIFDLAGKKLTGPSAGFHMYFYYPRACNLPVLADRLFRKLWCLGYGTIFITKIGSKLPRTIFDKTVFSPERLDFVAGANCIDCTQTLPTPVYRPGSVEMAA